MMLKEEEPNRRRLLLKEIAKLFYERGYEKTSIRDISRALGISNAGLYYHFKDKQEMLFAITSELIDEAIDDLRRNLPKIEKPEDQIFWIIYSHIMYYKNNKNETKVLVHERYTLEGEYAKLMREKEKEYVRLLEDTIRKMVGDTATKDKLKVATYSLLGMLNWLVHWYDPEGSLSPEELAKGISNIFLGGVKDVEGSGTKG